MKVTELVPQPVEKVFFDRKNFREVPQVAGCYVLTTFDGHILYVGQAVNLFDRFQQHLDNPEKTQSTSEGKTFWFYYFPSVENLNRLENTWFNDYEIRNGRYPILNKQRPPIS